MFIGTVFWQAEPVPPTPPDPPAPEPLTPAAVEAFVGASEVQKGRSYVDDLDDLTSQPVTAGLLLRGTAYGQESYTAQATLSGSGVNVLSGRCSCPVGSGCKHIAALLTRYVQRPGDFRRLLPLAEALAGLNTAQLHALIEQMLLAAPEVQELVQNSAVRPTGAGERVQTPAAQTPLSRRIPALFVKVRRVYHSGWQHGEEGLDTGELDEVLREADALLETQPGDALTVYLQMIESAEDAYATWADDEEAFDDLISGAVDGLLGLVSEDNLGGELRERAIQAVMELENPLLLARSGDLDDFAEALTDPERAALQTLLQKSHDKSRDPWRSTYARALTRIIPASQQTPAVREALLIEGRDAVQITEFYLNSADPGAPGKLVEHLSNHGRLDELFGLFDQHAAEDLLEQVLLRRGSGAGPLNSGGQWLFERYLATGRRAQATDLARAGLLASAALGWETRLRQVSSDWPGEWKTLFKTLQVQPRLRNQVLDLLLSGDHPLSEAETFDRVQAEHLDTELRLTLAARLAGHQATVGRAAEIQLQVAEGLIGQRGARHYAHAARLLGTLAAWLGKDEARQQIMAVAQEHRNLPSFQRELRNAGLI